MTSGATLRLLAVVLLWSFCFPLITLGLDLAPHLAFAAMRAAIVGTSLLALGVILGRPLPKGLQCWTLVGMVAVGATTLGFLGMFHAAEYVSPGLATVIANSQPLLAALMGHVLLGDRMRSLGKTGLIASLGGIVLIAWPGLRLGSQDAFALGVAFIVLAAVGVAGGNVAMKRLAGCVDAVMAMGAQLVIGAAPLALVSAATEDVAAFTWTTEFVAILVILSVFGTAIAFWL